MENASKDVLFTIAMNLELSSLLRWCESNSRIHRDVCQNDHLWRAKLLKDFPNEYPDIQKFGLINRSLRETYVFLHQLSYIKKLLETNESLYDIFLRRKINLSIKDLKKVPAFDLPNLQELYLSYNQLTDVPSFELPKLKVLDLSGNKLTEVPAFHLPKLQELYLYKNELTEVPSFDLPNLKVLHLSDNQLTEVPAFHFPNLQVLYLSNNQLTESTKNELKQKYKGKINI